MVNSATNDLKMTFLVKRLKMHAIHMPHAKTLMEVILVNVLMDFMQVERLV